MLTIALALVAVMSAAPAGAQALPRDFFGVAPQTALTDTDVQYMRAGRSAACGWLCPGTRCSRRKKAATTGPALTSR